MRLPARWRVRSLMIVVAVSALLSKAALWLAEEEEPHLIKPEQLLAGAGGSSRVGRAATGERIYYEGERPRRRRRRPRIGPERAMPMQERVGTGLFLSFPPRPE